LTLDQRDSVESRRLRRALGALSWRSVAKDVATGRDRAHFAAIAEGEALAEEERIALAAGCSPGELIQRGIDVSAETPWSPAHLAELDAVTDGQMELARRRIALGLGPKRS
jgi:hypothetical protein